LVSIYKSSTKEPDFKSALIFFLYYFSCFSLLLFNVCNSKLFLGRLFFILNFCVRVFGFVCHVVSRSLLIGKPKMSSGSVLSWNFSSRCSLVARNVRQGDERFSLNSTRIKKH